MLLLARKPISKVWVSLTDSLIKNYCLYSWYARLYIVSLRTDMSHFYWFKNDIWLPDLSPFFHLVRNNIRQYGGHFAHSSRHFIIIFNTKSAFRKFLPYWSSFSLIFFIREVALWIDVRLLCLEQKKMAASRFAQTFM